jgi:NAD(P)-dependent dehydrogenase (short-subunit alcohol dehydrogenase family)
MMAVVVGGASGMGRATVARLAGLGGTVAILDLPASGGAAVAKELGGGSTFHPCDVTDAEGTEQALRAAVEELGALIPADMAAALTRDAAYPRRMAALRSTPASPSPSSRTRCSMAALSASTEASASLRNSGRGKIKIKIMPNGPWCLFTAARLAP